MAVMLRGRGMSGPNRRLHWEVPRSPKELASHEGWNGRTRRMHLKEHEHILERWSYSLNPEWNWHALSTTAQDTSRYCITSITKNKSWRIWLEVSFQTKSVPQPGCKICKVDSLKADVLGARLAGQSSKPCGLALLGLQLWSVRLLKVWLPDSRPF